MEDQTASAMGDETARADPDAHEFDRDWVREHLREERSHVSLLGEIREIVFGAQDGLVSTLAVVSAVSGATQDRFPILIAGIASGLAGIFSMAAGEYISSKSQREIFEAQIAGEREEVAERPGEAEAEVAFMLEEDGLPPHEASVIAQVMARHPEVLLKTMVEKELGLVVEDEHASALREAAFMGTAFGLGAAVPIIPYLVLPVGPGLYASVIVTGLVLFAIGVLKTRWTRHHPIRSGLEVLALGAFAGIVGYFFGSILPLLVGVPEAAL